MWIVGSLVITYTLWYNFVLSFTSLVFFVLFCLFPPYGSIIISSPASIAKNNSLMILLNHSPCINFIFYWIFISGTLQLSSLDITVYFIGWLHRYWPAVSLQQIRVITYLHLALIVELLFLNTILLSVTGWVLRETDTNQAGSPLRSNTGANTSREREASCVREGQLSCFSVVPLFSLLFSPALSCPPPTVNSLYCPCPWWFSM